MCTTQKVMPLCKKNILLYKIRTFVQTHIAGDDHAAQLVNDQHIKLRGRLTELLLQDLQDGFHHTWRVPQGHRDVPQCPDGMIRDKVSIPKERATLQ